VLELGGCRRLVGLANNFGGSVPKLKRLEMVCCWNLETLPDSIGLLTELEHLDLSNCGELVTLPNAIVGLVGLKTLNLSGCSKLEEMALELGRWIDLHELDVGLKKLKKLEMEETRVWPLPTDLGLLTSLSSLSMDIPTGVPAGFDKLKALTHLFVKCGEDVSVRLRDSLGAFAALQSLHIASVKKIYCIPRSLGKLKCLLRVQIKNCTELSIIEALPQCLEHLDLEGCYDLIEIPSLMPMKSLVHLNLEECWRLRHIHGLECLTTLVFINLVGCASKEDHGVNVNKDNKALRVCALSGSKIGVAYNNGWLEVRLLSLTFCFGYS
jgi:Leucine-rich repeat (LRR) protein